MFFGGGDVIGGEAYLAVEAIVGAGLVRDQVDAEGTAKTTGGNRAENAGYHGFWCSNFLKNRKYSYTFCLLF